MIEYVWAYSSLYKIQTEEILNWDILMILKKFVKLTFLLYITLLSLKINLILT